MSSWLCVDASLVVRLVVEPDNEAVRDLWNRWDVERRPIAAPQLLTYEVSNALYRYERLEAMSSSTVRVALEAALALPIQYYAEPHIHLQALDLAARFALSAAYDAHYLALTEWLNGEFWTADQRLVRAVEHELSWVHLLGTDMAQ